MCVVNEQEAKFGIRSFPSVATPNRTMASELRGTENFMDALPLLTTAMAQLTPGELIKVESMGLLELMGAVEVR